jgi:hypothetical protein
MSAGRWVVLILLSVLTLVDYFGPVVLSFLLTVILVVVTIGFLVHMLIDLDDRIIIGGSCG